MQLPDRLSPLVYKLSVHVQNAEMMVQILEKILGYILRLILNLSYVLNLGSPKIILRLVLCEFWKQILASPRFFMLYTLRITLRIYRSHFISCDHTPKYCQTSFAVIKLQKLIRKDQFYLV